MPLYTQGNIMAQFEHAAAEDQLPPLVRLRRDDGIKLLKAHGIEIPTFKRNGKIIPPTKSQIMPILQLQMSMGTFKEKPKYPEFLLSAGERAKLKKEHDEPYHIKNRGPRGGRWCIMEGDKILLKDYTTEIAVKEAMADGLHLSTSGQ